MKRHILDNEGVQVCVLRNGRRRRRLEVLLLPLFGNRVLVPEDKVDLDANDACKRHVSRKKTRQAHLGARAGQVLAEHDNPRSLVRELLALVGIALLEELDVSTSAVAALLELGLVLHNERLASGVKRGRKRGRDSVVGSLGFGDQALVANNGGAHRRFLDGPLADVRECLAANGGLLGCLRRSPSVLPVVRKLLHKSTFDRGGLNDELD